MGRWAQKVWVIETPDEAEEDRWAILPASEPASPRNGLPPWMRERGASSGRGAITRKGASGEGGRSAAARPSRKESPRAEAAGWRKRLSTEGWGSVVLAYLLGPLTLALWLEGNRRAVWAALGIASFAICVLLLVFPSSFTGLLERVPHGDLVWLTIVPGVFLLAGVAWARAVAAVVCRGSRLSRSLPDWVTDPRSVIAAGLLVPGLGMLLAGFPKRAAYAFWIVGPLAAGVAVLQRWRWLWEQGRAAMPPDTAATTLEAALLLAATVAAGMSLLWILQALEGMRLAAKAWPRSRSRADAVSVALLISLLLLAVNHPPTSLARNLHVASVSLRLDGFQLIPLVLSEAAARLDPIEPEYLAHAAELDAALGREEEARLKREIIAQRLEQYVRAAGKVDQAGHPSLARLRAIHLPERAVEQQQAERDGTWSRIRVLYD